MVERFIPAELLDGPNRQGHNRRVRAEGLREEIHGFCSHALFRVQDRFFDAFERQTHRGTRDWGIATIGGRHFTAENSAMNAGRQRQALSISHTIWNYSGGGPHMNERRTPIRHPLSKARTLLRRCHSKLTALG